jgi:tRNA(fMet)-specific endonuclease VapC
MAMLTLDTCFLIDYQREAKGKQPGPVMRFLERCAEDKLQISVIAWGEFLAGFADRNHPFVSFAYDKLELLPIQEETAETYRELYRDLKVLGQLIGSNDLWIAAHAIALDRPLVSRNENEFGRIPSLDLRTY